MITDRYIRFYDINCDSLGCHSCEKAVTSVTDEGVVTGAVTMVTIVTMSQVWLPGAAPLGGWDRGKRSNKHGLV